MGRLKIISGERYQRNSIFYTQQDWSTYEIKEPVIACTRPAQIQARQYPSMMKGSGYKVPPLTRKILAGRKKLCLYQPNSSWGLMLRNSWPTTKWTPSYFVCFYFVMNWCLSFVVFFFCFLGFCFWARKKEHRVKSGLEEVRNTWEDLGHGKEYNQNIVYEIPK